MSLPPAVECGTRISMEKKTSGCDWNWDWQTIISRNDGKLIHISIGLGLEKFLIFMVKTTAAKQFLLFYRFRSGFYPDEVFYTDHFVLLTVSVSEEE